MGVLKVNVGDAVTPDWRKIGCGGGTPALVLQLVADDLALSDNDLVMSWTDGINAFAFAPGDATVAPTLKTGIMNGHDVVRWASGKQLYRSTTPSEVAGDSFTHIMVISTSTSGGTRYVYGIGGGDTVGTYIGPSLTPDATDNDGATTAGTIALGSGTPSIVTVVRDVTAGTLAIYVDGVLSDSESLIGWDAPSGGFSIGDNQANYPNNSFIGDLAELRMYDGALAPADRYAVEDDLATTYGITLAGSAPAAGGRLKLWTGTEWVRERCDDDSTTYIDDFNRADTSNDTTNWQTGYAGSPTDNSLTKVGISSNQLYCSQRDAGIHSYAWDKDALGADADMQITLSADSGVFGNNGKNGLAFRINPADGSFFFLTFNTLWYCDSAGSLTTVYNFGSLYGVGFQQGDVQRIVCAGNTIHLYRNGTEVGPGFTSTLNQTSGTRHGVELGLGATGGQRWDDWSITILPPAHPLKLWDGTSWVTVACMVPA